MKNKSPSLWQYLLIFCFFSTLIPFISPPPPATASTSPAIDELMGGSGRAELRQRLENLNFTGGKTYAWEDYSGWGREIFHNGFVADPPEEPAPSRKVSEYFKCVTCHNDGKEDPDLLHQDPEARFQMISANNKDLYLVQGATMWGIVNRESFYGGFFSKYHDLCISKENKDRGFPCGVFGLCFPGCRTMDPVSLDDAVQVCANYCSVGHFLRAWELYSLLAYFWDLEIHLNDLDLTKFQLADLQTMIAAPGGNQQNTGEIRRLLAGAYLLKAANTYRNVPVINEDESFTKVTAIYDDGAAFTGDPDRGRQLYSVSCVRCHGTDNMQETAEELGGDPNEFYGQIAKGSLRLFGAYMPAFSLERLSRRQAADILSYLRTLMPDQEK